MKRKAIFNWYTIIRLWFWIFEFQDKLHNSKTFQFLIYFLFKAVLGLWQNWTNVRFLSCTFYSIYSLSPPIILILEIALPSPSPHFPQNLSVKWPDFVIKEGFKGIILIEELVSLFQTLCAGEVDLGNWGMCWPQSEYSGLVLLFWPFKD